MAEVSYPNDPIIEEVLQRIAARADAGLQKFGVSITGANHSTNFWIDNAIEEAMDLAVYLTKLKRTLKSADDGLRTWICNDMRHLDDSISYPCPRCQLFNKEF